MTPEEKSQFSTRRLAVEGLRRHLEQEEKGGAKESYRGEKMKRLWPSTQLFSLEERSPSGEAKTGKNHVKVIREMQAFLMQDAIKRRIQIFWFDQYVSWKKNLKYASFP
jgi:hypothetical protein